MLIYYYHSLEFSLLIKNSYYDFLKHFQVKLFINGVEDTEGDFPVTDSHTKKIITFPCDQHLTSKEIKYVVKCVKTFYKSKKNI